jgi:hypothetical protein
MSEVRALNREAVKEQSPGLPRCAAILGSIGSKGRNPDGCEYLSWRIPNVPPSWNVGLCFATASRFGDDEKCQMRVVEMNIQCAKPA